MKLKCSAKNRWEFCTIQIGAGDRLWAKFASLPNRTLITLSLRALGRTASGGLVLCSVLATRRPGSAF